MAHWNKIDWHCPVCGKYWMTTENCSPEAHLHPDCECKEASTKDAIARCHECGDEFEHGETLCCHFDDTRSHAV